MAFALATAAMASGALGQVYEKVFDFGRARAKDLLESANKGAAPVAGLVRGSDGNFYGTTRSGGSKDFGTVFKMTPDGVLTTLVEFTENEADNKGAFPRSALVQGSDEDFYGTTSGGGANFAGTIFKVTPAGVLATLVEFTVDGASNRGSTPLARLVLGTDGNFYGTTALGGSGNFGTVFRMTPAGVLTTLVEFTNGNKGRGPMAGLVQGSDGNFYGTTQQGGASGAGTIFRMTPAGVLTTLVQFSGDGPSNRGSQPQGDLVLGGDGNFYGVTKAGGASGFGTVFRMTPGGLLTTLVEFTGNDGDNLGAQPVTALVQGNDGSFYGTTSRGGGDGFGTAFKMTPAGALTTLAEFTYRAYPSADLVLGIDGDFYGAAEQGGASGTIFKMTAAGVLTTLVEFAGRGAARSGTTPAAALVRGNDDNLYGTTRTGGTSDFGTVYRVTPTGVVTTLVEFTSNDASNRGANPNGTLVLGNDGNFYGTTAHGGIGATNDVFTGNGTVFVMTPEGVLTTLVEFTGNAGENKGRVPLAGLVQDSNGDFYGTTSSGGANNFGTIFKVTPSGVLTTLVEFTGAASGSDPQAELVEGSDGDFYGTTRGGGASGHGTVFKVTSLGILTTLLEFSGNGASNKGRAPVSGLVPGGDGIFYGMTGGGGASDFGTIFKMTPAGSLETLVEFTGNGGDNKGRGPAGELLRSSDGNFYGTTSRGGANGEGTVFKMNPGGELTTIYEFPLESDGRAETGLTAAADGSLYGTTSGRDGTIYRLLFPGAPLFGPASVQLEPGHAVVFTQVNGRNAAATVSLALGRAGQPFPESSIQVAVLSAGYQTKSVGTSVSDLIPGEVYQYQFTATSSAGTSVTPIQTFVTLAEPVVAASPASEVAATSARFNGMVNARNFDTMVAFEWGTDGNSFPHSAPATPGVVTGNALVPVSAAVAGLPEAGTIFFRIRATNAAGTVVSGTRSFNTGLGVTTSAPGAGDVGVEEAVFRATINPKGQTVAVKFKYWPESIPTAVLETATQLVTSSVPVQVSARSGPLLPNTAYRYQVSVEVAGVETEGSAVPFTTQTNLPPVALPDLVFYSGQVVVAPLENDIDPNDGTNANLSLDSALVVPPNASLGVASVTDGRFINYNPQFNIRDDDALTYRVLDPLNAGAEAQVRLIAFSKRAGLYGGRMIFGTGAGSREGQVAVQMGTLGSISTSFLAWPTAGEGLRESFVLKGEFDQHGRLTRAFNSPSGAVLRITLQLDPDASRMHGTFEERVNDVSTTGEIAFTLTRNMGTGGLAASGLRTGFLSPPPNQAGSMADGFVRMTVGKNTRRGARFAGRMPDGEPFLAAARAEGRTYALARPLEQGGLFTGLVRAIDNSANAGGMMGELFWQKRPSSRARFHRGGVATTLSLVGVAYPEVPRGALPPLALGANTPNARLRLGGGDLGGSYRDVLLNILPGSVQVVGPDPSQTGLDVPMDRLRVRINAPQARFTGRFFHPQTRKLVPFEGALRAPLDLEPAQGRGLFRGPSAAGSAILEAATPP